MILASVVGELGAGSGGASGDNLVTLVALAMLGALILYALLGGADFGGGVWDLVARGPRAAAQRTLIERALAPVWEANHVWLIIVVVILFTGFPAAFSSLAIALHVPLTLLLLGIVTRGAAFTFRHYDDSGETMQKRWGRVFAIASSTTPIALGVIVGAITSGRIHFAGGLPEGGFFRPWLRLFPLSVGLFTLALFSFLAAVYLTVEAQACASAGSGPGIGTDGRDPVQPWPLVEDFRRRSLVAGLFVFATALATTLAAGPDSASFQQRLLHHPLAWPIQIATALAAVSAFAALLLRRYGFARAAAQAQVALIILGWGLAQRPYLIAPDITLDESAAPPVTLRLLLVTLGIGSLLLVPSLYWLLRIFKRDKSGSAFAPLDEEMESPTLETAFNGGADDGIDAGAGDGV